MKKKKKVFAAHRLDKKKMADWKKHVFSAVSAIIRKNRLRSSFLAELRPTLSTYEVRIQVFSAEKQEIDPVEFLPKSKNQQKKGFRLISVSDFVRYDDVQMLLGCYVGCCNENDW